MMKLFDWLFRSHKAQAIVQALPHVGAIYSLKGDSDNPFPQRTSFVQVMEVKSGWVRYNFLPLDGAFQNQALKIDSFLRLYSLHKRHDEECYAADFLSANGVSRS